MRIRPIDDSGSRSSRASAVRERIEQAKKYLQASDFAPGEKAYLLGLLSRLVVLQSLARGIQRREQEFSLKAERFALKAADKLR